MLWHDGDVLLTVVDAFAERPFSGNPAAVAILEEFPSNDRMQLIAREMNLSETAFVVNREEGGHHLRWFTPAAEVDLCGHATLAAAHVLGASTVFHTRSGPLTAAVRGNWIEMDFPALNPGECPLPALPEGFPSPVWSGVAGDFWLIELSSSQEVTDLVPDQRESLPSAGVPSSSPRKRIPEAAQTSSAGCSAPMSASQRIQLQGRLPVRLLHSGHLGSEGMS
jgi:predicted PhzF superfamily epimerase YddE/YHI9